MSIYLLVLFFLLSVFLTGGVLKVYKNAPERFTLQSFFAGGTYYFWRLLRMTVYFFIIHAAIAGAFVFLYQKMTEGGFDVMGSEVGYINLAKKLGGAYLLIASWFFMVQDYAKIHMVHRNKNFIFRSFWQSFPLVFGHFFNTFLLYILNALTFVGVVALYLYLSQLIMQDTPQGIALALLLGQAFVIARIAVRLLNLSSATLVYKGIMAKREKKELLLQEAEETRLQAIADAEAEAAQLKALATEAEYEANIAQRKARLAGEAATAIGASHLINTSTSENIDAASHLDINTTIEKTNLSEIPPVAQDALRVVTPPPIENLFDEEE